jgi:hypothetical protein
VIPEKLLLARLTPLGLRRTPLSSPSVSDVPAGVLGYANLLFKSRGGCTSESGGGYRPIRGAHILCAGKRLLSGCPALGFSSIWPSEKQRLADIRCLVVHSVMSYAEMGAQRCPMTTKQRFTAIKQQYTSSRDISQPWGVQPAEQRGRLTEVWRARLEERGRGRGRWRRLGRPEGYRVDEQRKEEEKKATAKIAWQCQEQGKKPLGGLLGSAVRFSVPRTACSCWLALHVSLEAGKAAPANRPAPVSPFLCSPTCTAGKPRATPYSFLSNYGSGRALHQPRCF